MSHASATGRTTFVSRLTRRIDKPIVIAFACIVALLLVGGMFSLNFTSPEYILLQLKVGAFLGIIATGLMMVILLGHIDLSLPWTITVGAMMACAVAGHGDLGRVLAIPVGIGCGVLIGIVNGILVALLRIPSMIATLATNAVAQGIMIVYTGGSSPQDSAPEVMRWLAAGWLVPGVPNAVALWVVIGGATMFLLSRTTFGRTLYAIGNTERAAYLSGIDTRLVTVTAFAVCSAFAAFGGVLLAGYASKAAQSMGDAYLLPAIAAVVLGGTSILGGRGSYLGTVAGAILITLLQSILSVAQMPEAGRQIIYGVVIAAMLLLYGRSKREA
jgi:ribose transport system permease protein